MTGGATRSRRHAPRSITCRRCTTEFNGDWLLAIAAYNCGELRRAGAPSTRNERLGRPTDFWHLKLPTETRGYVPKLLAMRRLVANPAATAWSSATSRRALFRSGQRPAARSTCRWSRRSPASAPDELYELNPAFHRWATDPTGPFRLLVPIESAEGLEQTLAQLTPEQRMRVEHYTVQRGDTVAKIATHFRPSRKSFASSTILGERSAGHRDGAAGAVAHDRSCPKRRRERPMMCRFAGAAAPPPRAAGRRLHVVRRGDTLYGIAQRLGTDVTYARAR